METALYTHHHYGWRRHELPDASHGNLLSALIETHGFLREYEGDYRVEVERTTDHGGKVQIYWQAKEPKALAFGRSIRTGEIWFIAFEFNVARYDDCRYCGGTGIDHYSGPFAHCWACDGSARQVRDHRPRNFMHKPTEYAPRVSHERYAEYLAS